MLRKERGTVHRSGATQLTQRKTQIVVVGGGAGGLELVRRLGARYGRERHDIILVEKNRTHVWKPLLHEVAAGSLDANLDEVGYRSHCHRWGYRYFLGTLEGDRPRAPPGHRSRRCSTRTAASSIARHAIRYDYLVIAVGSVTNDFGTPGVAENCMFLDDRAGADRFRNRLLNHCLRVSRAMSAHPAADAHVRIAIVGGGATGVELAAELYNSAAALRHYGLEVFDESRLADHPDRGRPAHPAGAARTARRRPRRPSSRRSACGCCTGGRGDRGDRDAIVTAERRADRGRPHGLGGRGQGAAVPRRRSGSRASRNSQLVVRADAADHPRRADLRDRRLLLLRPPGAERPVPPRAQAAHQMAGTAFANLVRLMRRQAAQGRSSTSDHGSLVSLSRFSTVGSLMGNLVGGRMAIEGRLARLVYTSLYRMHLIAIHGWLKGAGAAAVGRVNRIIRPRLKLH